MHAMRAGDPTVFNAATVAVQTSDIFECIVQQLWDHTGVKETGANFRRVVRSIGLPFRFTAANFACQMRMMAPRVLFNSPDAVNRFIIDDDALRDALRAECDTPAKRNTWLCEAYRRMNCTTAIYVIYDIMSWPDEANAFAPFVVVPPDDAPVATVNVPVTVLTKAIMRHRDLGRIHKFLRAPTTNLHGDLAGGWQRDVGTMAQVRWILTKADYHELRAWLWAAYALVIQRVSLDRLAVDGQRAQDHPEFSYWQMIFKDLVDSKEKELKICVRDSADSRDVNMLERRPGCYDPDGYNKDGDQELMPWRNTLWSMLTSKVAQRSCLIEGFGSFQKANVSILPVILETPFTPTVFAFHVKTTMPRLLFNSAEAVCRFVFSDTHLRAAVEATFPQHVGLRNWCYEVFQLLSVDAAVHFLHLFMMQPTLEGGSLFTYSVRPGPNDTAGCRYRMKHLAAIIMDYRNTGQVTEMLARHEERRLTIGPDHFQEAAGLRHHAYWVMRYAERGELEAWLCAAFALVPFDPEALGQPLRHVLISSTQRELRSYVRDADLSRDMNELMRGGHSWYEDEGDSFFGDRCMAPLRLDSLWATLKLREAHRSCLVESIVDMIDWWR